jgi:hypothetical protein
MANSTTNLDLIAVSQANKEVTANALLDAASPAMLYGRRAVTTAGLAWGYFGGTASVSGAPTAIANGTVTLTASSTNYIEADPATGAVSVNTTGFTSGYKPLYSVVTGAASVTSYTDLRTLGGDDGTAAAAIAAHEAASDPHPQYLTQTEADALYTAAGGGGSVTSVSVATANGVSGSVATATTTPAITLTLGAITPSSVAASGTVTGSNMSGTNTGDETATTAGALINGATAKTTPVDADHLGLMDSAASNVLKKLSWANLKATLKTYFDTLYASASQPFDLMAFYPGVPTASALVTRVPVARAVTFPSGLTGSVGKASVAATASTAFDIQKNGTSVGTMTFAASATSATFTAASAISLAAGDILSIVAPGTADATLASVGIVLAGSR